MADPKKLLDTEGLKVFLQGLKAKVDEILATFVPNNHTHTNIENGYNEMQAKLDTLKDEVYLFSQCLEHNIVYESTAENLNIENLNSLPTIIFKQGTQGYINKEKSKIVTTEKFNIDNKPVYEINLHVHGIIESINFMKNENEGKDWLHSIISINGKGIKSIKNLIKMCIFIEEINLSNIDWMHIESFDGLLDTPSPRFTKVIIKGQPVEIVRKVIEELPSKTKSETAYFITDLTEGEINAAGVVNFNGWTLQTEA